MTKKIMQDSLSRILTKEGYEVQTASSGEEAIEKFDRESFDIVLLDIKMPGIGGIETLRRLKEMDPAITILIVTGYPQLILP